MASLAERIREIVRHVGPLPPEAAVPIRHYQRTSDHLENLFANDRVGVRLAEVLTALHADDPTLFAPQATADELSATFTIPLTVAGVIGTVPPP